MRVITTWARGKASRNTSHAKGKEGEHWARMDVMHVTNLISLTPIMADLTNTNHDQPELKHPDHRSKIQPCSRAIHIQKCLLVYKGGAHIQH